MSLKHYRDIALKELRNTKPFPLLENLDFSNNEFVSISSLNWKVGGTEKAKPFIKEEDWPE